MLIFHSIAILVYQWIRDQRVFFYHQDLFDVSPTVANTDLKPKGGRMLPSWCCGISSCHWWKARIIWMILQLQASLGDFRYPLVISPYFSTVCELENHRSLRCRSTNSTSMSSSGVRNYQKVCYFWSQKFAWNWNRCGNGSRCFINSKLGKTVRQHPMVRDDYKGSLGHSGLFGFWYVLINTHVDKLIFWGWLSVSLGEQSLYADPPLCQLLLVVRILGFEAIESGGEWRDWTRSLA